MEYDERRLEQKSKELFVITKQSIVNYWSSADEIFTPEEVNQQAKLIMEKLVQMTPPEEKTPMLEMIVINSGGNQVGYSIKPGNISLNLRKLIVSLSEGGLALIGVVAFPWTAPLAAIVLWDKLWSNIKVEISEQEAALIYAMWKNREQNNLESDSKLLRIINNELKNNGRNPIRRRELDRSLKILSEMKCIEKSQSDSSKWWLREWISVEYR